MSDIPKGWMLVPIKITHDMADAAMVSHYGKARAERSGMAAGIVMTVNDLDYSGIQAMRRLWKGALSAVPAAPTHGADARPVAIYLGRIETGEGNEAWVELADEDRKYWRDTVRSVYATRDAAPSDGQAQQLRYAIHSLQVIADGIVGPAPYAELAIKHIGVVAEASRSEAVPEGPLKQLGARLATLLDEDQFNGIEPLLDACTQPVKRYVLQKQSGSSMARVIDTHSGMTIKAYDIFKRNGWDAAKKHADALNVAAIAPMEKT